MCEKVYSYVWDNSLVSRLPDLFNSCFSVYNIEKLGIGAGNEATREGNDRVAALDALFWLEALVAIHLVEERKSSE